MPSGTQGQLLPAWDLNGQVCVLPDGRFVGGLRPHAAGPAQPRRPEALQAARRRRGARRAQRLVQRPDPLRARPLQDAGPVHRQRLAAHRQRRVQQQPDLHRAAPSTRPATSSATTSPPRRATTRRRAADGWWSGSRRNYTTYCIVYGPDAGGVRAAPHRRDRRAGPARDDGAGRQRRPARAQRRHLERAPLRRIVAARPSAAQCPGGRLPAHKVQVSTFFKVVLSRPASPRTRPVAASPSAATSGSRPSVWVTNDGQARAGPGLGAGHDDRRLGKSPTSTTPFGMAFAPDGTLYFVDIHIACNGSADRLRAGRLRGPGDEGDLHQRPTLRAGRPWRAASTSRPA